MLFYTGLFILVIAVSLDGFGVGITYGMQQIRVPFFGLFIIMLCSGLTVLLSMTIGHVLSSFISPEHAESLGGTILILLGMFSLYNLVRSKHPKKENRHNSASLSKNIFRTILDDPDHADLDQSGTISFNEALLLGFTLAMDAFGAGLGAAVIGYSPVLTAALVALMSGLFVLAGIKLGFLLAKSQSMRYLTYVPPCLLITIGLFNAIS